jgi:hypothetical protein
MENKEIATTILQQIGGNQFKAMTGAYNIFCIEKGLAVAFKGCKTANRLEVKLDEAEDVYTMKFYKFSNRTLELNLVKTFENVYCDELQSIFEDFTGLLCSLRPSHERFG